MTLTNFGSRQHYITLSLLMYIWSCPQRLFESPLISPNWNNIGPLYSHCFAGLHRFSVKYFFVSFFYLRWDCVLNSPGRISKTASPKKQNWHFCMEEKNFHWIDLIGWFTTNKQKIQIILFSCCFILTYSEIFSFCMYIYCLPTAIGSSIIPYNML